MKRHKLLGELLMPICRPTEQWLLSGISTTRYISLPRRAPLLRKLVVGERLRFFLIKESLWPMRSFRIFLLTKTIKASLSLPKVLRFMILQQSRRRYLLEQSMGRITLQLPSLPTYQGCTSTLREQASLLYGPSILMGAD